MLFGLRNAAQTFQQFIDQVVFSPMLTQVFKECCVDGRKGLMLIEQQLAPECSLSPILCLTAEVAQAGLGRELSWSEGIGGLLFVGVTDSEDNF
jgi:hypothetical protein